MDETKKMLRSILVSTPLTVDVTKLNKDFREVAGYEIPYRELGYKSILDFLNAIPDVLRVNGNSMYSEVTLIVSEKTAHVNNMVLKQRAKKGCSVGRFFAAPKRRGNQRFSPPSRMAPKSNYMDSSPRYSGYYNSQQQSQSNCYTQNHSNFSTCYSSKQSNICSNNATNKNYTTKQNTSLSNHIKKTESHQIVNAKITHPLDLDLKLQKSGEVKSDSENNEQRKQSNQLLRRLNYEDDKLNKDSPRIPSLLEIKLDMTNFNKLNHSGTKNEDKHLLRRLNYKEQHFNNSTSFIPSVVDIENDIKNSSFSQDELLNKDKSDFMRQLLLKKETLKIPSERNSLFNNNNFPELGNIEKISSEDIKQEEYILESRIPRKIQDNLKELMSDFPEGIWCTQLPTEYRKKFRRELDYEDLGFRCLINMCMDLENIFHCSKESSCDFKLYDVRKPVPRVRILEDHHISISDHSKSSAGLLEDDAVPKLDWSTYATLLPEDAVGLNFELPREFVGLAAKNETFFVVVAEIYDPSKFWLYKNDGNLDALMNEMQLFYRENQQKYQIPEYLLEIGLYCAVVTLNEYHRALVVKSQRDNDFVNVFFIDYGSLGTAPKNQVWFLTNKFVRLPAQAIRARLADIYPPVEYTTWSVEGTNRFQSLASMKQVDAKISKVIPDKKIIEVYIENPDLAPDRYINDVLVQEGHALHTSQARAMSIEDPNCIPRVKFVHLFPDFEEIEYWLAPSIEQMAGFAGTDLTADFFFPQYFTRPIDKNLHDKIEAKAKRLIKRKEKPVKYIDAKKLESMRDMREGVKVAYGSLYERHKEELDEWALRYNNTYYSVQGQHDAELIEENEDSNFGDYENLLNKLRSKRLNSIDVENKKVDRPYIERLTNPSSSNYLTVDEEEGDNEDICKKFYGCFVEETIAPMTRSSTRKDTTGVEKYLNQLDKWGDLSELEKYLSEEEEPSTPSTNNGKLIDLDDLLYSASQSRNSSKSISLDHSLDRTTPTSKGPNRRNRFSLLSDPSSSDVEEQVARRKHRHSPDKRGDSVCSDLIQLDVELDCPILMPQIVGNSGCPFSKPNVSEDSVENASDADDEDDSDGRLNPHAKVFMVKSPKSRNSPAKISFDKAVQIDEATRSNAGTACVSSSSNDPVDGNFDSNALIRVSSNAISANAPDATRQSDSSVALTHNGSGPLRSSEVSSSSDAPNRRDDFRGIALAGARLPGIGPPPGFGPVPRYGCPGNRIPQPGFRCTVYQPWSTVDCVGNGLDMNLQRQHNGLGFTPQQYLAQVSSVYGYPPIVVFNYNGLPPAQPAAPVAQHNPAMNFSDNFYGNHPAR